MKLQGKRCQCTVCGEYFTAASNFDRHRVSNRGVVGQERWCLSAFGIEAVGLVQRQLGDERLWSMPGIALEAPASWPNRRFQAEATHG